MINWYIIIFLIFLLYIFTYKETMENIVSEVKNFVICQDCKAWNHVDIKSNCTRACKKNFPEKNIVFTGNSNQLKDNQISCECSFTGKYNKDYVGCPIGSKFHNKSCFIWNLDEAKKMCQPMCDQYLPRSNAKWTGSWKNTSATTSACECEYYS